MYSPKISKQHVKKLWKMKVLKEILSGKRTAMTEMVNEALVEYIGKESRKLNHLIRDNRDKDMMTLSLQLMEHRANEVEKEEQKRK